MNITSPLRVVRSCTHRYAAPAARVFPLFCPVREADWIDGWEPAVVLTNSGVAELDCVFVTGAGEDEAVWTVTRHEPEAGRIEFVRFGPGPVVSRIAILVRPDGPEASTADITYRHTALSPAGAPYIEAFGEAWFRDVMHLWERRLNHYLATGEMLSGPGAAAPPAPLAR